VEQVPDPVIQESTDAGADTALLPLWQRRCRMGRCRPL